MLVCLLVNTGLDRLHWMPIDKAEIMECKLKPYAQSQRQKCFADQGKKASELTKYLFV